MGEAELELGPPASETPRTRLTKYPGAQDGMAYHREGFTAVGRMPLDFRHEGETSGLQRFTTFARAPFRYSFSD